MKNSEKTSTSLWAKRDQAPLDKEGPLYEQTARLRNAFDKAKKYNLLEKRDNGSFYADPVRDSTPVPDSTTFEKITVIAETAIRPKDDGVYIALNNQEADETTYYRIGTEGVAVDLDASRPVDNDSDELAQLKLLLKKSTESLESSIRYKEEDRQETRQKIGRWVFGVVGASALAGGAYWGYQTWWVQPHAAADAQRTEYDTQGHTLPGEGMPIEAIPFEAIPVDQFDAIPWYGGIDRDLKNPRTIKLSSQTGCADLTTNIPQGADLRVALPEGSSFLVDHYFAYPKSDGFTVCVAEGMPSDNKNGDLKIAVQVK